MFEVRKVCFIGAGTQGCLNSLICSVHGFESLLYDISPEVLDQVSNRQQAIASNLAKQGYAERSALEQALSEITVIPELSQAVAEADLVHESVTENLELKRTVHKELDALCPPETVLTTNTSSLLVSELETAVARGDRFAALHFNGTFPFIDLVGGPRTSPQTLALLTGFIKALKMRPMLLNKEKDGYLGNTMLISFLISALLLVIDGHADLTDVDRSWMMIQGTTNGPFGQMDIVGLNVVRDIIDEQARRARISPEDHQKITAYLRQFIARGDLGVKTGRGFYDYPRPAYRHPQFLKYD